MLNNFFSSVFTEEDKNNIPVFNCDNDILIDNLSITNLDMEKALSSLKINKSLEPDGIHPRILKELSKEIACPLKLMFDKTLKENKLPSSWKEAEVRPIF